MHAADRLFEDLRQRREDAWVKPWHRVVEILRHAGGIEAARAAQRRGEELKETEGPEWWEPSDVVTGDLRSAFRRWVKAGWLRLTPPPSDVLPIPEMGADLWDAAHRRWRKDRDVDALLQLACLRAYREEHGPVDRTGRHRISPAVTPE